MWLSENIGKSKTNPAAESGEITLSSPENWEAFASEKVRNVSTYAPYGLSSVAPAGEEVLLLPVSGYVAALGTKSKAQGLEAGEVRLCSKGGACIELKNDGSIVLNGTVIIDKRGRVSGWQTN